MAKQEATTTAEDAQDKVAQIVTERDKLQSTVEKLRGIIGKWQKKCKTADNTAMKFIIAFGVTTVLNVMLLLVSDSVLEKIYYSIIFSITTPAKGSHYWAIMLLLNAFFGLLCGWGITKLKVMLQDDF